MRSSSVSSGFGRPAPVPEVSDDTGNTEARRLREYSGQIDIRIALQPLQKRRDFRIESWTTGKDDNADR